MNTNITDENFDEKINVKDKFVLVDFFATWCEPCRILGPILEKVAENFKDKVVLIKADVDKFPKSARKFEVESIPRIILFKNGKQVDGFVGLIPEKKIKDWLENLVNGK